MNKKLSKWFKDNCKDIGHLYYGKIQQIIEKHEAEEDMKSRYFNALMKKISGRKGIKPEPTLNIHIKAIAPEITRKYLREKIIPEIVESLKTNSNRKGLKDALL